MELDDAQVQQLQNKKNEGDFELLVQNHKNDVMIQINPPQGKKRTPLDICCVVDTSGSMGSAASVGKDAEQTGLSILDIVKHALKTIIHSMQDQDNLSIVRFDDRAEVKLKMTKMDKKGQTEAETSVDDLRLGGCTNLWDGLQTGMDLIREGSINKNTAVLVFTDGIPNIDPPRGYVPTLQKYLDEHGKLCQIHTFGFGYSLNSKLLNQISQIGNGSYAFIPDAGMVGTVFINAVGNLLCNVANHAVISIEPLNGAALVGEGVIKGYQCQKASWGLNVNIGTVQYDQSRNVAFQMDLKNHKEGTPYLYVKFKYNSVDPQFKEELSLETEQVDKNNGNPELIETHLLRIKTIQTVEDLLSQEQSEKEVLEKLDILKKDFEQAPALQNKQNTYLSDLLKDLTGEIYMAFQKKENFLRWGQHYLPSLLSAHLNQQQNNFKDHGVQHYGGPLFKNITDLAEKIFIKLPPPKPSKQIYGYNRNNNNNNNNNYVQKPINMAQYNNRGGVCFARDSLVLMKDGSLKKVQDVKRGDQVVCGRNLCQKENCEQIQNINYESDQFSQTEFDGSNFFVKSVECVVESLCFGGEADMVQLGELILTTHHPVKINGKWQFPADIAEAKKVKCDSVFSFLLKERSDSKCLNTIIVKGPVIGHKYFSSEKIVNDMKQIRGWENGHIILKADSLVRCPKSTQIVGLNIQKNNHTDINI